MPAIQICVYHKPMMKPHCAYVIGQFSWRNAEHNGSASFIAIPYGRFASKYGVQNRLRRVGHLNSTLRIKLFTARVLKKIPLGQSHACLCGPDRCISLVAENSRF